MDVAPIAAAAAARAPLRIRRNTDSQRAYLPRSAAASADLVWFARHGSDAAAAQSLDARLAALRASLLRSPWWSGRLRDAGLAPSDLQSLRDLQHFPTLDRTTLARSWHEIVALPEAHAEQDEIVAVKSSGTSGDPVAVPKDRYDCLHMWSVLRFWTSWLGLQMPPHPRVVLLCSLPSALEYSVRLPLFHAGALHRLSLARPKPLERLQRIAPAVVFADPECLHWLAAQSAFPPPALLLSSASHLPAELRTAFDSPIVNYYATTETGPIAWECLEAGGRFHVLLPDVWVESVSGELLVTRLRPSVLPLLRYRTGDTGNVVAESCTCGYRGLTITGYRGRGACYFSLPSGTLVDAWRLAWVFKQHPLRSFRLTQLAPARFRLDVVAGGDMLRLRAHLSAALASLGWSDPHIEMCAAESIAAGPKPEPFRAMAATTRSRIEPR